MQDVYCKAGKLINIRLVVKFKEFNSNSIVIISSYHEQFNLGRLSVCLPYNKHPRTDQGIYAKVSEGRFIPAISFGPFKRKFLEKQFSLFGFF